MPSLVVAKAPVSFHKIGLELMIELRDSKLLSPQ